MFASVLRVTGTAEADWTISHQSSTERFEEAREALRRGESQAFGTMLYARVFFPDGAGELRGREMSNKALGLPQEDLDEATRAA
ncbi:hypothetical protein HK405_005712, partial [Cladochytrium tenue]